MSRPGARLEASAAAGPSRAGGAARHVMMVAPTPFFADRGCHVRILEEIRALERRGWRTTVCTYHLGRDLPGVVIRRTPRIPWYRKLSAGPSVHKFYVDPLLALSVLRAAWRDRPDVIHGHLHEGILAGWPAARLLGVPLVADLQGSLTGELLQHGFFEPGGLVHRVFRTIERGLLRLPSGFVLSSERAIEGFAAGLEALGAPARVVTDGVDVGVFHPAAAGEELRRRLGLPAEGLLVGYLGVLDAYQGVPELLEAARLVVAERPDTRFLVMGYPHVEHYREEARRLGIDRHVILPGRIPYGEARDWLAACDVAVSAKRDITEANGKLLNYIAVGLPVVATDTPINREVLGELGRWARVGDAAGLAAALLDLLGDPVRRQELGRALRRRAEDRFDWDSRGELIAEVYDRLPPARGRRGGPVDRAGDRRERP